MSSTSLNNGNILVSLVCLLIIAYIIINWDCTDDYENRYVEGMKMSTTTSNDVVTSTTNNDGSLSISTSKKLDWIVPAIIIGVLTIAGVVTGVIYWYEKKNINTT
jgi:hypothetical protein